MPLHKAAREFALRHKLNLGRDEHGYFLRAADGAIVDRPWAADHAHKVVGALAMMRRALR
jgi:hypothetical protein